MRGRFFLWIVVVAFFSLSCEDPTALSVSKAFGNNDLVTVSSDTFSVITSTVQLDTILTSSTGTMLVGEYNDPILGDVVSSPYFQLGYGNPFKPAATDEYDSIGLILHYYNKQFYGDTTQTVDLSLHELTQLPVPGSNPPTRDIKLSIFNYYTGFYTSSNVPYDPTPLATQTVKFRPHDDSLYISLPKALGAKWFRLAQNTEKDSAKYFSDYTLFVGQLFKGLYLKVTPSGGGSIVAFDPTKMKIRLFYEQNVYDISHQTHFDFEYPNAKNGIPKNLVQFQNISTDRSGSPVASIQARQVIPSSATNHETFIQSGTGLVTKLEFPSLKNFFLNRKYSFNGAYLQVFPVEKTYSRSMPVPPQLILYTTDDSNVPTGSVSNGTGAIRYDYEYGINTYYSFTLFNYVYQEISTTAIAPTPLMLAPAQGSLGNNVQRVVLGDQLHPTYSRIKLIVYYSYASN